MPICIIIFFFIIFASYLYLHEFAGHYLANLISGISPEQMEIIWLKICNINLLPFGIKYPQNIEPPSISYFAGGFIAGLLLLLLSILLFWKLYRKKRQELFWWFFTITLGFSCDGFTESIFEGFFLEYHRGILEASILFFFTFAFAPLLWLLRRYHNRILSMVK
jgi:hypothetical protein